MALRPNVWRTPAVRTVLAVGAILGAVLGVQAFLFHLNLDPLGDARAYYDAATRLNAGLPLYVQSADTNSADFYRYPPLLAIAFRPLALLPFGIAALIWEGLLVAAFGVTLWRVGIREPVLIALGFLGVVTAWSLTIGQAQVLVTALLALGTPLGIALATNLKVFPGLVAVWWLARGDWRSVGRCLAWGVGLVALQFVLEPAGTLAYVGFLSLDQVGAVDNRSLYSISPALWAVSVVVLLVVAVRLARTRYGWPAAIVLSLLATPRLLNYQLSTLLAALREPDSAGADRDPGAPRRRWALPVRSSASDPATMTRPST